MSKRWAKLFVNTTPNTKFVRVQSNPVGNMNECYQNALQHSKQTGSKMVAGWIVMDSKHSSNYANNPGMLCFAVRHWWNKHRGVYVDTTPFAQHSDMSYVVQKDQNSDSGWITEDNINEHVKYCWETA